VTTATSLLDLPPDEATRRVALDFLAHAEAARHRLADPADAEALHDFRVALRRLRSTIRAYREQLHDALGRRTRRRLRTLAAETGASRDAEVQLEWLAKLGQELDAGDRGGVEWIVADVTERKTAADARLRRDVTAAFDQLHRRVAQRLSEYTLLVRVGEDGRRDTLAAVVAHHARALAGDLRAQLDEVRSVEDQDAAHEARIAAKRLRYLLEPLGAEVPGAPAIVKRVKSLQDVLGDMHDMDVLAGTVAHALADDAAEGVRPGLLALADRVRARRDALYAKADEQWLGGRGAELFADVEQLAAALDGRGTEDLEIERKYLLRELPERVRGVAANEIAQGWLPGEKLRERLRCVRDPNGAERCYRTVKLGKGLVRVEIEEETTHELFAALWKHTTERRVRKRRYAVTQGDLTWEIDEFTDRDLVLAEIELPSEDTVAELPDWLAPYVVREVTGEAEFVNYNLGKAEQ
jgi:CHAD domain-containing protein/CYTH domain-containing protein